MAIHDRSARDNFVRGADTGWHRANMLWKNIVRLVLLALVAWVVLTAWWFTIFEEQKTRAAMWAYAKASLATTFFLPAIPISIELENADGDLVARTVPARQMKDLTRERFHLAVGSLAGAGSVALVGSLLLVAVVVTIQVRRGRRLAEDQFLRGAEIVPEEKLIPMVKEPSEFKLGNVPIPRAKLTRNILLTGAMGVGKSQALMYLLDAARAAGVKLLVYDKTGEFTEFYYRAERDHILNIFDTRAEPWSVFADLRQDFDFAAMSTFFVPENKRSSDPVWDNAARILLEDVLRIVQSGTVGPRSMARVQEILTQLPLPDLAQLLREHKAASCGTINENNERGSESIRLTLAASPALKYFAYIPDPKDKQFSIRDWAVNGDDSWLFLTSRSDLHNVMKPFISLWTELALLGAMTLRPVRGERKNLNMMIILDELASLPRMRGLETALTEASKFGVCTVVGMQGISQGVDVYGKESWDVMLGNLQNKFVMRVEDQGTAKEYSDLLGKREIQEVAEGQSFGDVSSRDGVNLSTKRADQNIVLDSEIKRLPDLEGYVKLSGELPIAKTKVIPKSRPIVAKDFEPRGGLEVSAPVAAPTAAPAVAAGLGETGGTGQGALAPIDISELPEIGPPEGSEDLPELQHAESQAQLDELGQVAVAAEEQQASSKEEDSFRGLL